MDLGSDEGDGSDDDDYQSGSEELDPVESEIYGKAAPLKKKKLPLKKPKAAKSKKPMGGNNKPQKMMVPYTGNDGNSSAVTMTLVQAAQASQDALAKKQEEWSAEKRDWTKKQAEWSAEKSEWAKKQAEWSLEKSKLLQNHVQEKSELMRNFAQDKHEEKNATLTQITDLRKEHAQEKQAAQDRADAAIARERTDW
jgi:hypothetical protein